MRFVLNKKMHLPSYPGGCNASTVLSDYVAFSTTLGGAAAVGTQSHDDQILDENLRTSGSEDHTSYKPTHAVPGMLQQNHSEEDKGRNTGYNNNNNNKKKNEQQSQAISNMCIGLQPACP